MTGHVSGDILKIDMENSIGEVNGKKRAAKQKKGTTLTFSADELVALARYITAGMVLLQTNHPVTGRIKGALTRLGLPTPPGM